MRALVALKALGLAPGDVEVRVVPIGYKLVLFADPDGAELEMMQEA